MKKTILILSLVVASVTCYSQTQPSNATGVNKLIQDVGDILASPGWTIISGGGTSMGGARRNIAFSDVVYNVTSTNSQAAVGLVLGGDYLWSKTQGQFNTVKGGVTIQAAIHPFAFLGGTNFLSKVVATPFVSEDLAQPSGSSSNIGNLTIMGAQVHLFNVKNFEVTLGGMWEKRQGQGQWDGQYALGEIGFTRKF